MLNKTRHYITEDAATKIYKTMILPYLDYGDIIFINSNQKQLKKLQTLQNRALRTCLNTRLETPIEILHQSIQIPKLNARREAHLINFMFKYRNNNKFLNNRNVRTRLHDAPVFNTVKPNNEKYKNNVFYNRLGPMRDFRCHHCNTWQKVANPQQELGKQEDINFTKPWDHSDIVLIVEDQRVYANKMILSMSSPMMKAMFESDFKEKDAEKILVFLDLHWQQWWNVHVYVTQMFYLYSIQILIKM